MKLCFDLFKEFMAKKISKYCRNTQHCGLQGILVFSMYRDLEKRTLEKNAYLFKIVFYLNLHCHKGGDY